MARSSSGLCTSNSGGFGSAQPSLRCSKGGGLPEHPPLPNRGGKAAPRVLKVKKKKEAGRVNAHDN